MKNLMALMDRERKNLLTFSNEIKKQRKDLERLVSNLVSNPLIYEAKNQQRCIKELKSFLNPLKKLMEEVESMRSFIDSFVQD